jgi:hypothetical protein
MSQSLCRNDKLEAIPWRSGIHRWYCSTPERLRGDRRFISGIELIAERYRSFSKMTQAVFYIGSQIATQHDP